MGLDSIEGRLLGDGDTSARAQIDHQYRRSGGVKSVMGGTGRL
jgi:hypothetical protein